MNKNVFKFYVASKWEDRYVVRDIYKEIRKHGHRVTLDWTVHDLPNRKLNQVEKDLLLRTYAMEDINGVRECDILIALFTEPRHQRGAMIEVGAALGLGKFVLVIGHAEDSSTLLKHNLVYNIDKLEDLDNWFIGFNEVYNFMSKWITLK